MNDLALASKQQDDQVESGSPTETSLPSNVPVVPSDQGGKKVEKIDTVITKVMQKIGSGKAKPVKNAAFPELVDLVSDDDGNVAYLIASPDGIKVEKSWTIDNRAQMPPGKDSIPFSLPAADKVLKLIGNDSSKQLFEDIQKYFLEICYLNAGQLVIATTYAFLTYLHRHPEVYYLPELLFYAVPERGKSRAGKALTHISYRGIISVDVREANLFRFSDYYNATLFLDVTDMTKKIEQGNSMDLMLQRYERGAKVARVLYPDRGPFDDMEFFDVYGPTIIATNEEVHKILDTRCIPITMENKPGVYKNITADDAVQLKERLVAWKAASMNAALPDVDLIEQLQGRMWDISKPLLQVCKLVSAAHYDVLVDALLDVAGYRIEEKKESLEGRIVAAIYGLSPDNLSEWKISTADVLTEINKGIEEKYQTSSQGLGRRLKKMGMTTSRKSGHSEIHMKRDQLDVLESQYGIKRGSDPGESPDNDSGNDIGDGAEGSFIEVAQDDLEGSLA